MADCHQLFADGRNILAQGFILINSIGANNFNIGLLTESQLVLLAEKHKFSFLGDGVNRAAQTDCNQNNQARPVNQRAEAGFSSHFYCIKNFS